MVVAMRLPAPILEHPIESVIASLLLAALLFVSADPRPRPAEIPPTAVAQKM
jgi:hypothetical protein